jgi:hypothetical protein
MDLDLDDVANGHPRAEKELADLRADVAHMQGVATKARLECEEMRAFPRPANTPTPPAAQLPDFRNLLRRIPGRVRRML